MDLETLRTLADIGLGAIAIYYCRQQGKILTNHETRLVTLETKPVKT